MEGFTSPLWDLSQATTFSQLPDDDFLALLQKQFPSNPVPYPSDFGLPSAGINPQSISRYSLPSLSPPSEDSSPSPPQQGGKSPDDDHHEALKRKASSEDFDEGPSAKTQHTSTGNGKKPTRRKSSGTAATNSDESRLLKRKEQNRAAQRAFRERKEKHVKDLEDKVAALEAKNDEATSENENLRDLLSRLQQENVMLKKSSFTFSVPKPADSLQDASASMFSTTIGAAPSPPSAATPQTTNPLDWSSLTSFDPTMLSLLDETPQQTATDGAMNMDFGFTQPGGAPSSSTSSPYPIMGTSGSQFKTIASNPMFTSFATVFDSTPYQHIAETSSVTASPYASTSSGSASANPSVASPFSFDMGPLSAWSTPNPDNTFDDLFGGFMANNTVDFNDFNLFHSPMNPSPGMSPVVHGGMHGRSPAASSSSSKASSIDPLFGTPRESSGSESDNEADHSECPKTKAELRQHISTSGQSPFAAADKPSTLATSLRKADSAFGPTVMCEGSAFPSTAASENNLEILTAWRKVTSNPQFRDTDIAELCSEFSSKARCDGTKVVLEPQNVQNIINSLNTKYNNRQ